MCLNISDHRAWVRKGSTAPEGDGVGLGLTSPPPLLGQGRLMTVPICKFRGSRLGLSAWSAATEVLYFRESAKRVSPAAQQAAQGTAAAASIWLMLPWMHKAGRHLS